MLQFTDRAAAAEVRKVLASAVANAVHNDSQDVEELFVVACYADEGPTLKRFRPRDGDGRAGSTSGRATSRWVVARMSDARLEVVQARQAIRTGSLPCGGTSAQCSLASVSPAALRLPKGLRGGSQDGVSEGRRRVRAGADVDGADTVDPADDAIGEEALEVDAPEPG